MKCAPSAKALVSRLGLTSEQAKAVRGLIQGTIDPETLPNVASWVRQCYNKPWQQELILCAINEVIGTHGVEAMGVNEGGPPLDYCNTGDTYADTIIYNRNTGNYYIGSWGDAVERWDR